MTSPCYQVRARSKATGASLIIRRFATQDEAIEHALKADMRAWDDVWVEPGTWPAGSNPPPTEPPPFPWTVLWQGQHAYVIDADGRKIAVLLGSQRQREFVAEIIMNIDSANAARHREAQAGRGARA